MNPAEKQQLVAAALDAQQRAYAPYSQFQVGAALLTPGGKIFGGANVENASYGLTICAERVAASTAVAAGEQQFVGLAVALRGGGTPCGACRQFLAEFGLDLPILLVDSTSPDTFRETTLGDLLPDSFGPAALQSP